MSGDEVIKLNVGGRLFETYKSTINKFPWTLLAKVIKSEMGKKNDKGEYFFDRNSTTFEEILDIYRMGTISCPKYMDIEKFNEELEYWGFDKLKIEKERKSYYNFEALVIALLTKDIKLEVIQKLYNILEKAISKNINCIYYTTSHPQDVNYFSEIIMIYFNVKKIEFGKSIIYDFVINDNKNVYIKDGDNKIYLNEKDTYLTNLTTYEYKKWVFCKNDNLDDYKFYEDSEYYKPCVYYLKITLN